MSHIDVFQKEKAHWLKVWKVLCKARYIKVTNKVPEDLDECITLAQHYASREFPEYQMHPFPTSFQTTDNVIVWREAGKVLLGKKKANGLWQFPGGFVDPADANLEQAAARERREECTIGFDTDGKSLGCICSHPEYIGSFRVPDPRYSGSPDKIMTAVFVSYYVDGEPKGGDDLPWVKWLTKDFVRRNYQKVVAPIHHQLVDMLIYKNIL